MDYDNQGYYYYYFFLLETTELNIKLLEIKWTTSNLVDS